jgi:superfamily I DNA and/or RNA helicase
LILLGDHQQLRPITASGELTYAYHMDVSLFERMVKNNFPRYQLEVQHRMRPEIRDLITGTIYPKLTDYGNVLLYPSVTGMAERLYFIDHRELETELQDESFSRSNHHEAKFLGALCSYLLSQGHQPEKITVLGMYLSQVKLLENEIWGSRQISRNLRVETADSFQGEENNIILLSLVRSNTRNSIGFMKTDNRICVALSRAKHGLYIIGNMELLAANSSTWKAIKMKLASKGRIGRRLTLICDKHEPDVPTLVGNSRDIDNLVGGCRVCRELAVEADNAAKQRRLKKKTEKLKKKIKSATFVSSQYSEF